MPILELCNRPEYASLLPSQIVPMLADQGEYIASESSFYRVLGEAGQGHRRGRSRPSQQRAKPEAHRATGPNPVWSWDITYLASAVAGRFYRLYLVMDIDNGSAGPVWRKASPNRAWRCTRIMGRR